MRTELQQKLVKDFPQIFRDYGGDPTKTCMAFGIQVGDGWFNLIYTLCEDLMRLNPPTDFHAEQVKEKFGGLRFYVCNDNNEISERISKAEDDSYHVCEECGSTENVTSSGSWIVTLCNNCRG